MRCPECEREAEPHKADCVFGRDIEPRFCEVYNEVMAWRTGHDINRLRQAYDKLSELIAWVAAYGASREH